MELWTSSLQWMDCTLRSLSKAHVETRLSLDLRQISVTHYMACPFMLFAGFRSTFGHLTLKILDSSSI